MPASLKFILGLLACAVALPGNFFNHYYQLAVPNLCLAIGLCAALPWPLLRSTTVRAVPLAVLAAAMIWVNDRYYTQPALSWPVLEFRSDVDLCCSIMSAKVPTNVPARVAMGCESCTVEQYAAKAQFWLRPMVWLSWNVTRPNGKISASRNKITAIQLHRQRS